MGLQAYPDHQSTYIAPTKMAFGRAGCFSHGAAGLDKTATVGGWLGADGRVPRLTTPSFRKEG